MDPMVQEVVNAVLRWAHVVGGIAWVGYAYFFVLTWGPIAAGLSPEVRGAVAPQLVERAVPLFRAVALSTWLTGVLLLGTVYHAGGLMVPPHGGSVGLSSGAGLAALLGSFFVYDGLYKSPLGRAGFGAAAVLAALFAALAFGLSRLMPGRALFLHLGGTLGTVMLMNAVMRLVPAQRRMVPMLKGAAPFDPALAGFIARRSAHNAVLSVATVAFMVAVHLPSAHGHAQSWLFASAIGLGGLCAGMLLLGVLAPPLPPAAPAKKE